MNTQLSRKRKKNHHKILVLREDKLNTIKVLISKALMDSNISHEFLFFLFIFFFQ